LDGRLVAAPAAGVEHRLSGAEVLGLGGQREGEAQSQGRSRNPRAHHVLTSPEIFSFTVTGARPTDKAPTPPAYRPAAADRGPSCLSSSATAASSWASLPVSVSPSGRSTMTSTGRGCSSMSLPAASWMRLKDAPTTEPSTSGTLEV